MAGLKHIQLTTSLVFDDDLVVTISTPILSKNIRNGEFFNDEQVKEILVQAGEGFAEIVDDVSLNGMHMQAVMHECKLKRNPKYGDDFSSN